MTRCFDTKRVAQSRRFLSKSGASRLLPEERPEQGLTALLALARVSGRVGVPPAVPGILPGSGRSAGAEPGGTSRKNPKSSAPADKPLGRETPPTAGGTPTLPETLTTPEEVQTAILGALKKFPFDSLDDDLKLLKLRVIKVSFIRQGRPAPEMVQLGIEKLSRIYPATGPRAADLNRELSELLVWLDAPDIVEKTLALMDASTSQEEQIWYACMLRVAKHWTPEQRERYFAWFSKAQNYHGGKFLYAKFIERIRDQALENVPDDQRQAMLVVATKAPPAPEPFTPAVQRDFQKAWTMADLEPDLPKAAGGRNFERGKEIYASTQCASCHLFHGGKGNVGPDLSAVGQRFQRRDILEAIVDPSKAISEQYASYVFTMKDGKTWAGRIANETNYNYDVIVDPIADVHQLVVKTALKSKEVSPVSTMPPGLINVLTKEEILDLLAYLETGGDPKAPAFKK